MIKLVFICGSLLTYGNFKQITTNDKLFNFDHA